MTTKHNSPTRPININIMITILDPNCKPSVMPIDKPHVPNADIVSKNIDNKSCLPSSNRTTDSTPTNVIANASEITANDLYISIGCISLLKAFIVVRPLLKFTKYNISIVNVVVLIPPPTELGEDPINISPPKKKFVASVK